MPTTGNRMTPMMDWDRVRVFHAVAQAGSFTRAAEAAGPEPVGDQPADRCARGRSRHAAVPPPCARAGADRAGRDPAAYRQRGRQADGVGPDRAGREPGFAGRPSAHQRHDRAGHGVAGGAIARLRRAPSRHHASRWSSATATSISACARPTSRSGGAADQPDLIQRRLMTVHTHIYGAPGYLERHGTPQTFEELDRHRLIAYGEAYRCRWTA